MLRSLTLAGILFVFWLLLSGYFTPFLISAGIGCSIAVVLLARRMSLVDAEGCPIEIGARTVLFYWPWLIKEIIKSGLDVSFRILDPRLPISPTLRRFEPLQKTDLGLVIHANSITLTPGTISVQVERDSFLVHALTREGALGLAGSDMDQRVARLEGK